jgi:AraC-like DNA-binding protein
LVPRGADSHIDWKPVECALQYLHEHFREPIYAHELARHAGVSESRLKSLFHDVLGIPWSRYLQTFRIHRSLDALGVAGHTIAEAAFAVGFSSLSHFNAAFRSVMGVSPREYASKVSVVTSSKTAKVPAQNGRRFSTVVG